MAEKFIKIIQNGISSLVPDTKITRNFWAKQNAKVSGSQYASKEMATIVEPDEDDLAFLNQQVPSAKSMAPAGYSNEFEAMKIQLEQQQALINKLLLGGSLPSLQDKSIKDVKELPGPANTEVADEIQNSQEFVDFESQEKQKGKPGPKPKTEK